MQKVFRFAVVNSLRLYLQSYVSSDLKNVVVDKRSRDQISKPSVKSVLLCLST